MGKKPFKRKEILRRSGPNRDYKKIFYVCVEGTHTEFDYFKSFNSPKSFIRRITFVPSNKNDAPKILLNKMMKHLKKIDFRKKDEAWIVVDRDSWNVVDLKEIYKWSQKSTHHGMGFSNPKFEYWLLLHFVNNPGTISAKKCDAMLKKYLPKYDKSLDMRKLDITKIKSAIKQANSRNMCIEKDGFDKVGTTLHKLVEKLIEGI